MFASGPSLSPFEGYLPRYEPQRSEAVHGVSLDSGLPHENHRRPVGAGQAKEQQQDTKKRDRELPPEKQEEVKKLKKRDAEVRRHEMSHLAAAGPYAKGPPHFEYEQGPDNKRYAVGGHVNIDTSPIPGDPQATIEKARVLKRAALAPSEPSSQDHSVAREAEHLEVKARQELAEQRRQETTEKQAATSPETTATTLPGTEAATSADAETKEAQKGSPQGVHLVRDALSAGVPHMVVRELSALHTSQPRKVGGLPGHQAAYPTEQVPHYISVPSRFIDKYA